MKQTAIVSAVGLALVVLTLGGARLQAQPQAAPPASGAATGVAAPPPAVDKWNFADEEEAQPTLRQIVGAQATDLVLFPAFVTLALVSFFRKSVRLKYVTLAASVLYLGLFRSQLISVVNIFGVLSWNLPIFKYSLFWYLFAGFTFVSTVLWGRLYCGRICAYGALTQLLDTVVPAKLRREPPPWLEQRAGYVKYGLLAAVVVYYLATRDISIYRYVEPFWMFSGHGSPAMWVMLAVLLTATVFVRNLYCRFLCPVGAFLGVISKASTLFPIKRWSECKSCRICEKACEWGAIQGPRIVKSECVRCDDCERLYVDQQKCVHWIVIRRKSDVMARQSERPAPSAGL
jgi:NosR/NirI family transcriptional regulator, nitrous oxide reductase regulator